MRPRISLTLDGRRLAYSAFAQTANVWSVPIPKGAAVSASTATPVTTGNEIIESIDVSSDGKWLAFDSDRNGNQDIFRMPLAGGEQEQLTSDPADDFQPHWSHDGRELGFHTFKHGTRDLYVMSATGRGPAARGRQRDGPGSRPGMVARRPPDVVLV